MELRYWPDRFEDRNVPVPVLYTTFMGLYGVDGILPYHFTNDIAIRREGSDALAAFLDIFHHRIISQYYRIWRKYHYPAGFCAGGHDAVSQALQALAGRAISPGGPDDDLPPARWLALLGHMSRRTRTADGLVAVVRHILPDSEVLVTEFHGARDLLDPGTLGRRGRLERHSVLLGRWLVSRMRAVRLELILSHCEQLRALQPGGPARSDLAAMLKGYLGLRWEVHLFARLPRAALAAPRLSRGGMVWLGLGACLRQVCAGDEPGGGVRLPLGVIHR